MATIDERRVIGYDVGVGGDGGAGESAASGLPEGWGWHEREESWEGEIDLCPTGSDDERATAYPSGFWQTWEAGSAKLIDSGTATSRDVETLLAAAQRCAVEALWAVDGFGVGEVRERPVPAQHVIDVGATTVLPGLAGIWTVMAAHYVNDVLVAVDARRVDARPAGDDVAPCPARGGFTVAPLSPEAWAKLNDLVDNPPAPTDALRKLFTSVSPEDFARLPRPSAADIQRALDAGRPPDLAPIATPESEGTGASDPLLPADHPLATRPRRDDAVQLVHAPFAPDPRAAETVAEMRRVSATKDAAEVESRSRAEYARGRRDERAKIDNLVNGTDLTHEEAIEAVLRLRARVAELEQMVEGGDREAMFQRERADSAERVRDVREAQRAFQCERADEAERHAEKAIRDGNDARSGWAKTGKDLEAARARVAELEAANARAVAVVEELQATTVTYPDRNADAIMMTLAAEQSVRNYLRAHGHDTDRPWDEVVIGLLSAPPVGSVAGVLAAIKDRSDEAIDDAASFAAKDQDVDAAYEEGRSAGLCGARGIIRSVLAPSPTTTDDPRVASLLEGIEAARLRMQARSQALPEGERGKSWACGCENTYRDCKRAIRATFGSPSPMGAVVAEVLALGQHGSDMSAADRMDSIHTEWFDYDGGNDGQSTRPILLLIAAHAIAGVEACDAAKGGA